MRKGDWVLLNINPRQVGLVVRVGTNGAWVDIRWKSGGSEWVKRMQPEHVTVTQTIPIGHGLTVTEY